MLLRTHAGLTTDEFIASAARWFEAARHPRFGVPYTELTYLPMLELIDVLRACEFRVFIVTGGGVEFVRAVSEELYGVAPATSSEPRSSCRSSAAKGRIELVRLPRLLGSPNEGEPKALAIQQHIGRRPIFAAGNSAGDREMLEHATSGPAVARARGRPRRRGARVRVRESLRDRPAGRADPVLGSPFGWTVVSMKRDWATVFGAELDP